MRKAQTVYRVTFSKATKISPKTAATHQLATQTMYTWVCAYSAAVAAAGWASPPSAAGAAAWASAGAAPGVRLLFWLLFWLRSRLSLSFYKEGRTIQDQRRALTSLPLTNVLLSLLSSPTSYLNPRKLFDLKSDSDSCQANLHDDADAAAGHGCGAPSPNAHAQRGCG